MHIDISSMKMIQSVYFGASCNGISVESERGCATTLDLFSFLRGGVSLTEYYNRNQLSQLENIGRSESTHSLESSRFFVVHSTVWTDGI